MLSPRRALLIGFAAIVFLSPGVYLFVSAIADSAGNALCAVGILVIILVFVSLRNTIQIAPEPRPDKQLVETGVYRYLRHPIYTGIVLCTIGLFFKKPTAWVAVAGGHRHRLFVFQGAL